jgi:amino acid transporter
MDGKAVAETPGPLLQGEEAPKRLLTWRGAFVVALIIPVGVFSSTGFAIASVGAWGAALLWATSIGISFLLAQLYTELATMFPNKPGGISLYAHEGWKKYFAPVGAVASFSYWFGWTTSLSVAGITIGYFVQTQWLPSLADWTFSDGLVDVGFPQLLGAGLVVLIWLLNVAGIRPTVRFSFIVGLLFLIPVVLVMFAPLTDAFSWSRVTFDMFQPGQAWGGWKLALVWLYIMGWSVYGIECVTTFTPEMRNPTKDVRKAILAALGCALVVYVWLTICAGGMATQAQIAADPIGFLSTALHNEVGLSSSVFILCIIASQLVIMNTTTADGGRVLYGMAKDRLNVKQLYHLNRHSSPSRAMTVDMVMNIILIFTVSSPLAIIAAGNFGYFLSVFFAVTGFILLRKDRPGAKRPIRVPHGVLLAGFLAVLVACLAVIGVSSSSITGYGGVKETIIGVCMPLVGFLLYLIRRGLQDRERIQWRDLEPEPTGETKPAGLTQ